MQNEGKNRKVQDTVKGDNFDQSLAESQSQPQAKGGGKGKNKSAEEKKKGKDVGDDKNKKSAKAKNDKGDVKNKKEEVKEEKLTLKDMGVDMDNFKPSLVTKVKEMLQSKDKAE